MTNIPFATIYASFLLMCPAIGLCNFYCRNQIDIDYGTLDNFTNHMCLYCLDTIISKDSPALKDPETVNKWLIDIPNKGNLIHTIHGNYRLSLLELENAIKTKTISHHFVLKEFSSQFYIVSDLVN